MNQSASLMAEFLTEDHVALKLRAMSKPALLSELARLAAGATRLPESEILTALLARETLGSTGFGAGIAVPHARIDGLARVVGFFARLDRPVAFEAIDDKPVDLVFVLLSPTSANSEHLAVLAAVSRRLRDRSVADAIRSADNAAVVCALLSPEPRSPG